MERFVDRDAELSRLRECYESNSGELAVIYGRRRLGKTQLVQHSVDHIGSRIISTSKRRISANCD
ncbi:ATP-binding protein, partial [Halarchaeum salinum]|uniref:ATP-binding protein n=1 Tax=Halarchaeum salinum TaxID=489912 RepID=UPI0031E490C5